MWISLIAMLLSTMMMVNVGRAPASPAKLYVDPSRWPLAPDALGHPGDEFYIAVKVEKVEDLWAAGFTIKFAPYVTTLVVSNVQEGDFLKQGGYDTYFTKIIYAFKGEVKIGVTRLTTSGLPKVGASGEGTLATMKFTVIDCGSSDIDIVDEALIDSNGNGIRHNVWNGYYEGVTGNLISIELPYGRNYHVGDTIEIKSKAVNKGDVPICVRTRFELERLDDGRRIRLYSGQTYFGGGLGEPPPTLYLYSNEYNPWIESGWTNPGASLIGPPDGNVASATTYSAITSLYGFEDVDLPYDGAEVLNLDIQGYTRQDDTGNDFDPYFFCPPPPALDFAWGDSMGGTMYWAWTGGRYYAGGPYDMPEYYAQGPWTEEAINGTEILIHAYDLSDTLMEIDSLRLRLQLSSIMPIVPDCYEVGPYGTPEQELDLNPVIFGQPTTEDMIGTYTATATLEYTLAGASWIEGQKVRTFHFEIKP